MSWRYGWGSEMPYSDKKTNAWSYISETPEQARNLIILKLHLQNPGHGRMFSKRDFCSWVIYTFLKTLIMSVMQMFQNNYSSQKIVNVINVLDRSQQSQTAESEEGRMSRFEIPGRPIQGTLCRLLFQLRKDFTVKGCQSSTFCEHWLEFTRFWSDVILI